LFPSFTQRIKKPPVFCKAFVAGELTLSLEVGGSQRQERENLCFPLSFLKKNEKNTGRCCVICVVFEIVRSTFAIDLYIYTNGTWSAKVHTYFHFAAVIKLFVLGFRLALTPQCSNTLMRVPITSLMSRISFPHLQKHMDSNSHIAVIPSSKNSALGTSIQGKIW
jgi:hypothetical protein